MAVRRVGRLTALMRQRSNNLILASALCFWVCFNFQDIELVFVGFFIVLVARMLPLFRSLLVGWHSIIRTRVLNYI